MTGLRALADLRGLLARTRRLRGLLEERVLSLPFDSEASLRLDSLITLESEFAEWIATRERTEAA